MFYKLDGAVKNLGSAAALYEQHAISFSYARVSRAMGDGKVLEACLTAWQLQHACPDSNRSYEGAAFGRSVRRRRAWMLP
jgi:hypothetical protein